MNTLYPSQRASVGSSLRDDASTSDCFGMERLNTGFEWVYQVVEVREAMVDERQEVDKGNYYLVLSTRYSIHHSSFASLQHYWVPYLPLYQLAAVAYQARWGLWFPRTHSCLVSLKEAEVVDHYLYPNLAGKASLFPFPHQSPNLYYSEDDRYDGRCSMGSPSSSFGSISSCWQVASLVISVP